MKRRHNAPLNQPIHQDPDVEVITKVADEHSEDDDEDEEDVDEEEVMEDEYNTREEVNVMEDSDGDDEFVPVESQPIRDDVLDINDVVAEVSSRKKKSNGDYPGYPKIPEDIPTIREPVCNRDILSSFELCNGLELTDDDVPVEIKFKGRKNYYKNATDDLRKKMKNPSNYKFVSLPSDPNETMLLPKDINLKTMTVAQFYKVATESNARTWMVPQGK